MEIAVILNNVRSVYNVGTVFRTANSFGARKIYLAGFTPSPIDRFGREDRRFAKVSLGGDKGIAWEHFKTVRAAIRGARRDGFEIWAVEQDKKATIYSEARMSKNKKVALLLGSETRGLAPATLRAADRILEIPMNGSKESLNVGIAFAIVGAHLVHNRENV